MASRLAVLLFTAAALAAAADPDRPRIVAIAAVVPSYVMIAGGSGVVISSDGLMLTNHHVIEAGYRRGGRSFKVRVGTRFHDAAVLGTDPRGDIALLRIQVPAGESLPAVECADSDALVVGQPVIAVGNPYGAMQVIGDPSVTTGIISLLHRNNGTYSDAIQTDAPVNPGNSGGPLLTLDGRLAGINGQIQSKTGARANTGIGLAIPANQIRRFLPLLEKAGGGVVLHGHLRGLTFDQEELDGVKNGAEITVVRDGSAAAKAGLATSDRIVAIDGMAVPNVFRLHGIVGTYPADSEVELTYIRRGKESRTRARLQAIDPGVLGLNVEQPKDAAALRKLLQELQKDRQAPRPVVVAAAPDDSPAGKAGIRTGDRIVALGGKPVPNILHYNAVQRALLQEERFFAGDEVEVVVKRGSGTNEEELRMAVTLGSMQLAVQGEAEPPAEALP